MKRDWLIYWLEEIVSYREINVVGKIAGLWHAVVVSAETSEEAVILFRNTYKNMIFPVTIEPLEKMNDNVSVIFVFEKNVKYLLKD